MHILWNVCIDQFYKTISIILRYNSERQYSKKRVRRYCLINNPLCENTRSTGAEHLLEQSKRSNSGCKAHLTNLRIWANAQRIWLIGQTRGIWPNAQRLVNRARVWPNARSFGQLCCAFDQMLCAFGQSYRQWPNVYAIRQMRAHLANCAAHLAKYFQNMTTSSSSSSFYLFKIKCT